jgi:SAM-dependent methyltransferase
MQEWYKEDLAYIHDVGFSDWATSSAPELLKILNRHHLQEGLIVDLGCGSGLCAREFVNSGYQVLGIDISEAMLKIARKRVPNAEFRGESIFDAQLPTCHAVTAIGECLNYLFDVKNDRPTRFQLFQRIYKALIPGGVFIFDIAEPGQVEPGIPTKSFIEGDHWMVLVEKNEDGDRKILTRRIITFRKVGEYYRRDEEIHAQQLYNAADIAKELEQVGFQVQISRSYGQYTLPKARSALVAHKR